MANLLYNLAQPFSDTKQYTQGVIVIYNDRMYEMTADEYTPGPFDPEKFTERFLSEMISGKLNSNLFGKPYGDGILTKCVSGTYHESSDLPDSLKITCGFKPGFICIQSIVDTTMSTSHVSIYRKNMSETVVLCASGISSVSTLTISPTSFSIQSIEDDGFVVGKYYSNGATPKTVYWYATE